MGIHVEATETIQAPTTLGWADATGPGHDRRWIGGLHQARRAMPPPLVPGTGRNHMAAFLGRPMRPLMEVAVLVTGQRLTMHAAAGSSPLCRTTRYNDPGDAACVNVRVQGDSGGLPGLPRHLPAPTVGDTVAGALKRPGDRLER